MTTICNGTMSPASAREGRGLIDPDWVRLVDDRRVALLARAVPQ